MVHPSRWGHVSSSGSLPPFNGRLDLGPFFVLFVYLMVTATTDAVNLTDGIDGLAAGCVASRRWPQPITFVTRGSP